MYWLFNKCVDYVYRHGLWFKLLEEGVSSQVVRFYKVFI